MENEPRAVNTRWIYWEDMRELACKTRAIAECFNRFASIFPTLPECIIIQETHETSFSISFII